MKEWISLLLLLVTYGSSVMGAKNVHSCESLFTNSKIFIPQNTFERSYYSIYSKYINKFNSLNSSKDKKVNVSELNSNQDEISQRYLNPEKALDLSMLGIFARIEDRKWDPQSHEIITEIYEPEYIKIKNELLQSTMYKQLVAEKKAEQFKGMDELSEPDNLDNRLLVHRGEENTVHVTFGNHWETNSRVKNPDADGLDGNLINRFLVMYMQLANRAYRYSNLERDKTLSGYKLFDDIVDTMQERKKLTFHFIFRSEVWQALTQILRFRLSQWENESDPIKKKFILEDEIGQPIDPFFPFAGILVAESGDSNSIPYEIKRYFSHDQEDPFAFLPKRKANELNLRERLVFEVISNYPIETQFLIRSHTKIHTRFYQQLGFQKSISTNDPRWPNLKIEHMIGRRETILEKLRRRLNI